MYEDIKLQLKESLPSVTLIIGARQSGKTHLLNEILDHWLEKGTDVLKIGPGFPLEFAKKWLWTAPLEDKKILVADGTLTEELRETLLLWSDDPPPDAHVIITDTVYPLDTLTSRSTIYLLKPDEAYAPPVYTEVKGVVLALLRAFESRDTEALDEVATRWTDNHTELLLTWCQEMMSGQFQSFTGEEVEVPAGLPLNLLKSMVMNVRPRFLIRGPVAELLWSMK